MSLARWACRVLLAGAVCAVLTGLGYQAGRHVERIDALRADAAPAIVVIGPRAAAARLYPKCQKRPVVRGQKPVVRGARR